MGLSLHGVKSIRMLFRGEEDMWFLKRSRESLPGQAETSSFAFSVATQLAE